MARCLRRIASEVSFWHGFQRAVWYGAALVALGVACIVLQLTAHASVLPISILLAGGTLLLFPCALALTVAGGGGRRWGRLLEPLLFLLPSTRRICHAIGLAHFAGTMGLLVREGVPNIRALAYAADSAPFGRYRRVFRVGVDRLVGGESLVPAITSPLLPCDELSDISSADDPRLLGDALGGLSDRAKERLVRQVNQATGRLVGVFVILILCAALFVRFFPS